MTKNKIIFFLYIGYMGSYTQPCIANFEEETTKDQRDELEIVYSSLLADALTDQRKIIETKGRDAIKNMITEYNIDPNILEQALSEMGLSNVNREEASDYLHFSFLDSRNKARVGKAKHARSIEWDKIEKDDYRNERELDDIEKQKKIIKKRKKKGDNRDPYLVDTENYDNINYDQLEKNIEEDEEILLKERENIDKRYYDFDN
jgi:hypothetical protein